MQKLAALSVDLDEVDNYLSIHGLRADLLEPRARNAIYDRAIPRLAQLFAELDVPATFFAIGRDLRRKENQTRLRALATQGHEIANHSLNHLYDLSRRPRSEQAREVAGGSDAIEQAVGARPVGFRAPGYTITDQLFEVLRDQGVQYDSSVFPCPPYYLAKVAAISAIRLRGRQSHSVVDHPRVLTAPADPYRVGAPYTQRGRGLTELPIGVTRDASGRLPYIGTALALAGVAGTRALTQLIASRPFVNLELHGIDLCGAQDDGLLPLLPYQADLRRSLADKRAALVEAVNGLKRAGFVFATLSEAARLVV